MTKSIHNKLFMLITLTLFYLDNAAIVRCTFIQTLKETVFFEHLILLSCPMRASYQE